MPIQDRASRIYGAAPLRSFLISSSISSPAAPLDLVAADQRAGFATLNAAFRVPAVVAMEACLFWSQIELWLTKLIGQVRSPFRWFSTSRLLQEPERAK